MPNAIEQDAEFEPTAEQIDAAYEAHWRGGDVPMRERIVAALKAAHAAA